MNYTKSEIFTAYNKIRAFARKNPGLVDPGRVNQALGLLLTKKQGESWTDKSYEYAPSREACYCKDSGFSYSSRRKNVNGSRYTGPCKHSIAIMLIDEIEQIRKENTAWDEAFFNWIAEREDSEYALSSHYSH